MNKTWIIYKHTCRITNKAYIGQTSQANPNQRWRNGNGYKPRSSTYTALFWNAIQKHGWENFDHEILESGITSQEEANNREIYWIAFYDTFYNGYNLTLGGDTKEQARLMSKDDQTIKVLPNEFDKYLADGWMFHDSIEYRPIKHRKWYEVHKEEQNERTRKYHEEHREEMNALNRENCKKLYQDSKFKAKKKQYRKEHPEIEQKIRENYFNKHHNDPEFKRKHAEANKRWAEKKKNKK